MFWLGVLFNYLCDGGQFTLAIGMGDIFKLCHVMFAFLIFSGYHVLWKFSELNFLWILSDNAFPSELSLPWILIAYVYKALLPSCSNNKDVKLIFSTCTFSSEDKDSFADFPYFFVVIFTDLMVFYTKRRTMISPITVCNYYFYEHYLPLRNTRQTKL